MFWNTGQTGQANYFSNSDWESIFCDEVEEIAWYQRTSNTIGTMWWPINYYDNDDNDDDDDDDDDYNIDDDDDVFSKNLFL